MRVKKEIVHVVILLGAILVGTPGLGQDKGTPITCHVTAVRFEDAHDWCTTGECSAVRFTIEGFAGETEYVLDCVEVLVQNPSPHYTIVCGPGACPQ
jgi:hypothetical protein